MPDPRAHANMTPTPTVLYSWTAKRSGAGVTVAHSCGKVSVSVIYPHADGTIRATGRDGTPFVLHVPGAF